MELFQSVKDPTKLIETMHRNGFLQLASWTEKFYNKLALTPVNSMPPSHSDVLDKCPSYFTILAELSLLCTLKIELDNLGGIQPSIFFFPNEKGDSLDKTFENYMAYHNIMSPPLRYTSMLDLHLQKKPETKRPIPPQPFNFQSEQQLPLMQYPTLGKKLKPSPSRVEKAQDKAKTEALRALVSDMSYSVLKKIQAILDS